MTSPQPDAADSAFGPLSDLRDVQATAEAIGGVLSALFADREPQDEHEERAVYRLEAGLERGTTGVPELDDALREKWQEASDRPLADWDIEVQYDDLVRMADTLCGSRSRPDTQIVGERYLETLIREDTPNEWLRQLRSDRDMAYELQAEGTRFTVRVGKPSVDLVMRCALRRAGFKRLHVFDTHKMYQYLMSIEANRALTKGSLVRIHAWRLLHNAIQSTLLSLRVEADQRIAPAVLEAAATAFRVRLAYEADLAYGPVLDVDNLTKVPVQPPLMRQLFLGAPEMVEAIGRWNPDDAEASPRSGLPGERLYGPVTVGDEEVSFRYLRAIAARDVFSAFMGFYHVVEYYMEDAWYEELSSRAPSLNPPAQMPSGAALVGLIRDAARLLGVGNDDIRLTERNAVKALVRTKIDISQLAFDMGRHLEGAVDYFAANAVSFADADALDLRGIGGGNAPANLADQIGERIYRVRNAITHSKSSRQRYSPYTDDLELAREVPLVRLVAEQLVVPPNDRL